MSSVSSAWKAARQTASMRTVLRLLQIMAGTPQRCMYCVDSHGTDIEHFWPKGPYPARAFEWPNLLLCCTECGRLKGDRFPLSPLGEPMLLDPSVEDPWQWLDFDPETGNLTACYDRIAGNFLPRGETTVRVLQLDRREGMAEGYRRTYRRLVHCVTQAIQDADNIDVGQLIEKLRQADDHGLMGWCFGPIGAKFPPFDYLRLMAPDAWAACVAAAQ